LDVESIRAGIGQLVEDETRRAKLIARGAKQVKQFSWTTAAEDALRVLEEAAT
jgi:hypothetical protein